MPPLKFWHINTWSLAGNAVWEAMDPLGVKSWRRKYITRARFEPGLTRCAFSFSDSCVWIKCYQTARCLPGQPQATMLSLTSIVRQLYHHNRKVTNIGVCHQLSSFFKVCSCYMEHPGRYFRVSTHSHCI